MSSKFHESTEILLEHQRQMEEAIDGLIPRAGSGMQMRGSWPIYLYRGRGDAPEEEDDVAQPFQLQMTSASGEMHFTRGRVQAGSHLVIPTIGGLAVDDSAASLPLLSSGGQVFARYTYTLDPFTAPYDWSDVFVECELVQIALNGTPPSPVRPSIGIVGGVSVDVGVAYTLLMCYAAGGDIIHYGQSSILPPDPNNHFPSEFVVFVAPQVRHVA